MNRFALVVFAIALLMGALLRFSDLGALEMSADEGATWAAASAPALRDVIAIQQTHNAGKLPVHDLILHEWIAVFGDSLPAMRSLSAIFGIVVIVLVIPTTREMFRLALDGSSGTMAPEEIDSIAAIAALLCATSLITIKYTREARMYALLLAFAMSQGWMFLRAIRRGALGDLIGLAILSAGLIATNLVTATMIATEGIWLTYLVLVHGDRRRAIFVGIAIVAGIAALSPALLAMIFSDAPRVQNGLVNWLTMPPWWEPAAMFNKATGSIAFPVLAGLAIYGIVRLRNRPRGALAFALLWMWAPPVLLLIGSHAWRPMFVERFAIYCFVPFFIIVAAGLWSLPNPMVRAAAIAAVVLLSLGHLYEYSRKPHDVEWHEAARVAQASLAPGDTIAVAPSYAVEVVRYYMIPEMRASALPARDASNSRVLISGASSAEDPNGERMSNNYPHVLARPRGVVVLAR